MHLRRRGHPHRSGHRHPPAEIVDRVAGRPHSKARPSGPTRSIMTGSSGDSADERSLMKMIISCNRADFRCAPGKLAATSSWAPTRFAGDLCWQGIGLLRCDHLTEATGIRSVGRANTGIGRQTRRAPASSRGPSLAALFKRRARAHDPAKRRGRLRAAAQNDSVTRQRRCGTAFLAAKRNIGLLG